MAPTLIYRDEATDDIAEGMAWYRDRAEGLDERFLKEVLACEAAIRKFPRGSPIIYKHFRKLPLHGFPYVMLYGEWKNEVVIYRVFHTSQHPKKRFRKKK
jgi:plasmid stabilization system protein ParE